MKSWKTLWYFAAVMICTILFSSAKADGGDLFLFRIRPQVEASDVERADGSFFIGTGRNGKQKTARLRIGFIGRSQEGETWDLAQLFRECSGSVLHAWWRVEARNPGALTTRFVLHPEDSSREDLQISAMSGWNLWNLTDWMTEAITDSEGFSCLLKGAKKAPETDAFRRYCYSFVSCILLRSAAAAALPGKESRCSDRYPASPPYRS